MATPMKKLTTTAQRVRAMIDGGHTNKVIIEKLKCKPHCVYNMRYQINKARGLGSIGALPKPTDGIGAPPKRKYVRKVMAGTGIIDPAQNAYPYGYTLSSPYAPMSDMQVTMVEPTMWQRIKGWFRG